MKQINTQTHKHTNKLSQYIRMIIQSFGGDESKKRGELRALWCLFGVCRSNYHPDVLRQFVCAFVCFFALLYGVNEVQTLCLHIHRHPPLILLHYSNQLNSPQKDHRWKWNLVKKFGFRRSLIAGWTLMLYLWKQSHPVPPIWTAKFVSYILLRKQEGCVCVCALCMCVYVVLRVCVCCVCVCVLCVCVYVYVVVVGKD